MGKVHKKLLERKPLPLEKNKIKWNNFDDKRILEYETNKIPYKKTDQEKKEEKNKMRKHIKEVNEKRATMLAFLDKIDKKIDKTHAKFTKDIETNLQALPSFNNLYDAVQHAKLGVVESLKDNGMMVYIGKIKGEAKTVFLPLAKTKAERINNHKLNEGDLLRIKNLKQLFQQKIETRIQENLKKLPNFGSYYEALHSAKQGVIKSFEDDGIVVYIGMVKGEAKTLFIPRKDYTEKIQHKEIGGEFFPIEKRIPKDPFQNQKWMNDYHVKKDKTMLTYTTHEGKKIEGKIIGYGESDKKDEVIFKPNMGPQFAIKVTTLEKGMPEFMIEQRKLDRIAREKRAKQQRESEKKAKLEKEKNRKILFDGTPKGTMIFRNSKTKRDGKKPAPEFTITNKTTEETTEKQDSSQPERKLIQPKKKPTRVKKVDDPDNKIRKVEAA